MRTAPNRTLIFVDGSYFVAREHVGEGLRLIVVKLPVSYPADPHPTVVIAGDKSRLYFVDHFVHVVISPTNLIGEHKSISADFLDLVDVLAKFRSHELYAVVLDLHHAQIGADQQFAIVK